MSDLDVSARLHQIYLKLTGGSVFGNGSVVAPTHFSGAAEFPETIGYDTSTNYPIGINILNSHPTNGAGFGCFAIAINNPQMPLDMLSSMRDTSHGGTGIWGTTAGGSLGRLNFILPWEDDTGVLPSSVPNVTATNTERAVCLGVRVDPSSPTDVYVALYYPNNSTFTTAAYKIRKYTLSYTNAETTKFSVIKAIGTGGTDKGDWFIKLKPQSTISVGQVAAAANFTDVAPYGSMRFTGIYQNPTGADKYFMFTTRTHGFGKKDTSGSATGGTSIDDTKDYILFYDITSGNLISGSGNTNLPAIGRNDLDTNDGPYLAKGVSPGTALSTEGWAQKVLGAGIRSLYPVYTDITEFSISGNIEGPLFTMSGTTTSPLRFGTASAIVSNGGTLASPTTITSGGIDLELQSNWTPLFYEKKTLNAGAGGTRSLFYYIPNPCFLFGFHGPYRNGAASSTNQISDTLVFPNTQTDQKEVIVLAGNHIRTKKDQFYLKHEESAVKNNGMAEYAGSSNDIMTSESGVRLDNLISLSRTQVTSSTPTSTIPFTMLDSSRSNTTSRPVAGFRNISIGTVAPENTSSPSTTYNRTAFIEAGRAFYVIPDEYNP